MIRPHGMANRASSPTGFQFPLLLQQGSEEKELELLGHALGVYISEMHPSQSRRSSFSLSSHRLPSGYESLAGTDPNCRKRRRLWLRKGRPPVIPLCHQGFGRLQRCPGKSKIQYEYQKNRRLVLSLSGAYTLRPCSLAGRAICVPLLTGLFSK